nr:uracil-DNA glycosylase [Tritonibacter mobilis]
MKEQLAKMGRIEAFVEKLADVSLPNVFNPYRDKCPIFDVDDAPSIRRANLLNLLEAARDQSVISIWVARDLGYRGGRRTGLALTDEYHLPLMASIFGDIELRRSTFGPPVKERTATTIWNVVERVADPIFMWNAFPFHPHLPDEPMSNRCHRRSERQKLDWVLNEILDLLKPKSVYSIGGDAKKCLSTMGLKTTAFRHPSYGGQTEFITQVERAYNLQPCSISKTFGTRQLELL